MPPDIRIGRTTPSTFKHAYNCGLGATHRGPCEPIPGQMVMDPTLEQPKPHPSKGDVWAQVMEDMFNRRLQGIERHGGPLQPHNGRDALIDLYQELLDAVVYTRQLIEERKDQ